MKHLFGLATLVFVGMVAWRIGDNLSSDAIGMAVGVLFGVLAGIPTALLVMAGGRRHDATQDETPGHAMQRHGPEMPYAMQPPVIVLAGHGGMPQNGHMNMGHAQGGYGGDQAAVWPVGADTQQGWPMQRQERQYKVVGESEEWIEEF